jgi:hypothetical protein
MSQAFRKSLHILISKLLPLKFDVVSLVIFFVVGRFVKIMDFVGIDWCRITADDPSSDWS